MMNQTQHRDKWLAQLVKLSMMTVSKTFDAHVQSLMIDLNFPFQTVLSKAHLRRAYALKLKKAEGGGFALLKLQFSDGKALSRTPYRPCFLC